MGDASEYFRLISLLQQFTCRLKALGIANTNGAPRCWLRVFAHSAEFFCARLFFQCASFLPRMAFDTLASNIAKVYRMLEGTYWLQFSSLQSANW